MNAQSNYAELWNDISEMGLNAEGTRYIIPQSYRTLELDLEDLSSALNQVPHENTTRVNRSSFLLSIPLPDNTNITFRVVESPVMADELAAKYPEIKTYLGQGTENANARVRFDVTPQGFHAIIFSTNGTVYIDPYSLGETEFYISYYKKDYLPTEDQLNLECNVLGTDTEFGDHIRQLSYRKSFCTDGPQLRTYRLALQQPVNTQFFHGGTVAHGLGCSCYSSKQSNRCL